MTVFENLGNVKNFDGLKKEHCDHAKLCSVLFSEVPIKSQAQEQNEIEVLKKSSEFLVIEIYTIMFYLDIYNCGSSGVQINFARN